MSNKKISRRSFLKRSGVGTISFTSFNIIAAFLNSVDMDQAFGQISGPQKPHLVQLFARGGGDQNHALLSLDPLGSQLQNGPIGRLHKHSHQKVIGWNGGSPITDDSGIIQYHQHGNHFVPHLWSSLFPTGSGGSVAATSLLNHCLNFQGIKNDVVGHVANQMLHEVSLVLGAKGISQLFEEAARTPMPTALLHKYVNHKNDAITKLLAPFIDTSKDSRVSDQAFMQDLKTVIGVFEAEAKKKGKPIDSLQGKFRGALALLETNFTGLTSDFPQMIQRYEGIINRIITQPAFHIAGVTDAAVRNMIIPSAANDLRFNYGENNDKGSKIQGQTMGAILDTANLKSLAVSCAMSEFLIKNNLCSHTHTRLSGIGFDVGNGYFGMGHDQHYIGSMIHLVWDSLQMQCIFACINEMMTALNSYDVLFQYSSEFSRRSVNLGDLQHYDRAQIISFFHKGINGFHSCGNVRPHTNGNSQLEAGEYANTDTFAGPVRFADVVATICQILDLPNPTPNGISIASRSSNGSVTIHNQEPSRRKS